MRHSDRKAIVLVLTGALIGFYPLLINFYQNQIGKGLTSFIDSTLPTIALGATLAFLIIICLLYGSGIISHWDHMNRLTKRWRMPLLIGVLDDIKWNEQNPNTFFHKIINFVSEGGLFVNVADIPFYFAYDSRLERIIDTTQALLLGSEIDGHLRIVATRPYFLTPLASKLSLQIVGRDDGLQASINDIIGVRGMIGTGAGIIVTRRVITIESNVESCVQAVRVVEGDNRFVSPLVFVKYGSGDFLLSLPWINDEAHDLSNKRAIKTAVCLLTLKRLFEHRNHHVIP